MQLHHKPSSPVWALVFLSVWAVLILIRGWGGQTDKAQGITTKPPEPLETEETARRQATLAKYDLDHDGRLNDDELYRSVVDINRGVLLTIPSRLAPSSPPSSRRRVVLPTLTKTEQAAADQKRLETYDTNHDGVLDAEEASQIPRRRVELPTSSATPAPTSAPDMTKPTRLSISEITTSYDLNHDGVLDKAERAKIPVSLRVTLPTRSAEKP